MRKYIFNIKMTSRTGAPGQMIIGAHPAADITALCQELNEKEFILIEQFFRDGDGSLADAGPTILNQRVVGKVREFKDKRAAPALDE